MTAGEATQVPAQLGEGERSPYHNLAGAVWRATRDEQGTGVQFGK